MLAPIPQNPAGDVDHVTSPTTNAVLAMPVPTTSKAVQCFLRKYQYYRKFIPNSSLTAAALLRAASRKSDFEWTDECPAAWLSVCAHLSAEPVLAHPDQFKPFSVDCDGSGAALAPSSFSSLMRAPSASSPTPPDPSRTSPDQLPIVFEEFPDCTALHVCSLLPQPSYSARLWFT
ncbi:hypothetical protein Efla_001338 [Eimeria flavescens]